MLTKKHILSWLAEWRDVEESGSNKYHVYNKAYKSFNATSSNDWVKIDDLRGVKYIGDKIRKRIESRAADEGFLSGPGGETSGSGPSSSRVPKHPGGTLEGASPPKRTRTGPGLKRAETTVYPSTSVSTSIHSTTWGTTTFGGGSSQLQRSHTTPTYPSSQPALAGADLSWLSEMDLTPEELALNMDPYLMADGNAEEDPFMFYTGRPSSPLAPIPNASQPKAKPKPKARTKPAARLSGPVLPPPAIASADCSLILDNPPIISATSSGSNLSSRTVTPRPLEPVPEIPPLFMIPPQEYDIHLLLDNREVKTQANRTYIFDELTKMGIPVIRESLNLGDVAFVARRKKDGQSVMLDCILERKRLDDLVGSIKDGRFHEQKFRLSRCGVSHIVYLVEEYSPEKFHEFYSTAINTSLSQTIVADGFEVQETRSIKFTIEYFYNLYWGVVEKYANKPIWVFPAKYLKRNSFTALIAHTRNVNPKRCEPEQYGMQMESFQAHNSKTGSMTVGECWARMLLTIRGMSAEKVAFVIAPGTGYPTPRSLYEAFKRDELRERRERDLANGGNENEIATGAGAGGGAEGAEKKRSNKVPKIRPARELLCEMGGSGRGKIGPSLSGQVYDLLMGRQY